MKYITALGIVFFTVLVWIHIIGQAIAGNHTYQQSLAQAKSYEEKGLYVKAIHAYGQAYDAAEEKDRYTLMMKTLSCYEQLKDEENAEALCRRVIKQYPEQQECYQKLLRYYQKVSNDTMLISLLEAAMQQFPKEKLYQDAYEEIEKDYREIALGYEEMSDWKDGYVLAKTEVELLEEDAGEESDDGTEESKETGTQEEIEDIHLLSKLQTEYRILNYSMSVDTEGLYYDNLSMTDQTDSKFIVQDKKGRWKMVNQKGYELENNLDVSFESIGTLEEGFTWAVIGGKYRLMNESMAVSKESYDEIGNIHDGYTGVKKRGKWAIYSIDDMKNSTGYSFVDLKSNEFHEFYVNECFMGAKKEGEYQLFDKKGKVLSDTVFEDMKPFVGQQPAAAKKDGKWGFINKDGTFYIEPEYEDAKSFSFGYAAVKKKGKWGFINKDNHLVVDAIYKDAKSFWGGGFAPVQNQEGFWDAVFMKTIQ